VAVAKPPEIANASYRHEKFYIHHNRESFVVYYMSGIGIIEKIKGNVKEVMKIEEVSETGYGPGYKITVAVGKSKKECTLIQDKVTGEWKTLGDPAACQILNRNLAEIGSPMTGASVTEKVKEQGEQAI
jgi:hypothetical protein